MEIPDNFKEEIKKALKERILQHKVDLPRAFDPGQRQMISSLLSDTIRHLVRKNRIELDELSLKQLQESLVSEIIGFGIIDGFVRDPEVTDIFVNGPEKVYVEKNGIIEKTPVKFQDNEEIISLIDKMIIDSGRRIDHASPFVDFKLKGGLRVTAVIPPVAAQSAIFTIRKMSREILSFDELKRLGTLNDKLIRFLDACVKSRVNILVAGSTGAGKTTIMNLMLRQFVPPEERCIIIEDLEEIYTPQTSHYLKILTRLPNLEGKGEIDLRELVKLSLHLRPDRIMIGEIRGEEAFHFLHAINTGHEGSMCTIHASNPEDALNRLEVLALMDRPNIQPPVVRRFLELGIDMIIQMTRLPNGQRVVNTISEFKYTPSGCEIRDIFVAERQLRDGRPHVEFKTTGVVPAFIHKLRAKTDIREDFFRA